MNHRLRGCSGDSHQARSAESGQGALETVVFVAIGFAVLIAVLVGYTFWMHRGGAANPHGAATPGQAQALVPGAPSVTVAAGGTTAAATQAAATATSQVTAVGLASATPAPAVARRQIWLVPFQGFPAALLQRLQTYFHDTYGLVVSTVAPISVPSDAVNVSRQQLIAERLLDALASSVRSRHPQDVTIGLTQQDMMIASTPQWQFGFSLRSDGDSLGVVSTARMDPANYGLPADSELLFHRALKMVAKNIGILYYGLPVSNDPTSVMYGNILSLDDLDRMGEQLPIQ